MGGTDTVPLAVEEDESESDTVGLKVEPGVLGSGAGLVREGFGDKLAENEPEAVRVVKVDPDSVTRGLGDASPVVTLGVGVRVTMLPLLTVLAGVAPVTSATVDKVDESVMVGSCVEEGQLEAEGLADELTLADTVPRTAEGELEVEGLPDMLALGDTVILTLPLAEEEGVSEVAPAVPMK